MPNQDGPVDNFDDLLDFNNDDVLGDVLGEKEAPEEAPVVESPKAVEEDPEDARIRELEAELAKPMPSFDEPLTEKQRRIKELEDKLAKRQATISENAPAEYEKATSGDKILIHILRDGFIALGQAWYRGQEIEFEVGGTAHRRTMDRTGASWLDLADDAYAQEVRWGHHFFARGPFRPRPGETFDDDIVAEDARRGRAAPIVRL